MITILNDCALDNRHSRFIDWLNLFSIETLLIILARYIRSYLLWGSPLHLFLSAIARFNCSNAAFVMGYL